MNPVDAARWRKSRHPWGPFTWTTRQHVEGEREQLRAEQADEEREMSRRAAEEEHERRIQALMDRQRALIRPTVELAYQQTSTYPHVDDGNREARFAKGVPLYVDDKLWAVTCPVASRISRDVARRFASVLLVVATSRERDRIQAATLPGQRFEIIEIDGAGRDSSRAH